ncbi:MAG: hypothetical protein U0359_00800 [Byssovorax sp.]
MDPLEREVIDRTLAFLRSSAPEAAAGLEGDLTRIEQMATVARSFPSMLVEPAPPKQKRPKTLVTTLCQVDSGMSSFNLPIRAVMGDAFLKAKAHLFKGLSSSLHGHEGEAPGGLIEAADREAAQTVYTMLLAELLWDLVRDQALRLEVRQRAATQLVTLWESPDKLEIDDFFPVLEAVWRARNRIKVVYGTLVGVSELFQLVREECPPFFVSFFTRGDVSSDEHAAFQEFLFGLPKEELSRLEEAMVAKGLNVIDREFAEDTLLHALHDRTPEALYASYRRRQSASKLRRMLGAPGPQHTAESYLVLLLLEQPAPPSA